MYAQPPAWVNVNVCPSTVTMPVRSGPAFDDARTAICAAPCPEAGESPESQFVWHADEWTARTQHSGESFPIGSTVRILEVQGATAIVGDALE